MESINCFTDRAEYFSKFRPGYPDGIIGLLEKEIGFDEFKDVATASLLEVWIDEAERRTWFLYEAASGRD